MTTFGSLMHICGVSGTRNADGVASKAARSRLLLCLTAICFAVPCHADAAAPAPAPVKVVSRAVEKFIRPGYARLHGDLVMLKTAMDDLCTTPGPSAFGEVREDFAAAVVSWADIGIIRLGPITEDDRLARMLSWPDPQGAAETAVRTAIASNDKSLTDAASLAGKSPALQGLTALEYVLYGKGFQDLRGSGGSFRCHYGTAIAQNMVNMAQKVQAEWDDPKGFRAIWTAPGPQNSLYHDRKQMLGSLVAQFSDALQFVQATRLGGLAVSDETTAPAEFLFSRSHNTFQALNSELDGMRLLFESSKIGTLLAPRDRWIADSISFEFRNAHDTLAPVIKPGEKRPDAAAEQKLLNQVNGIVARLSGLFAVKLARALDVAVGTATLERG